MAHFSPEFPISEPVVTTDDNVTVFRMHDGSNPPRFAVVEMTNSQKGETNVALTAYGPLTEEECFTAWPLTPYKTEEDWDDAQLAPVYPRRHVDAKLSALDRVHAAQNVQWLAGFILGKTAYSGDTTHE